MQTTIGDITAYIYCPWYQVQAECSSHEHIPNSRLIKDVTGVLRYVFVREMESGKFIPWSSWSTKWTKLFWLGKDANSTNFTDDFDRGSVLLKNLFEWYGELPGKTQLVNFRFALELNGGRDLVECTVPVVQALEDGSVELIYWDVPWAKDYFRRDIYMRTGAVAVHNSLPECKISGIRGIAFSEGKYVFKENVVHPNEDFYETGRDALLSVVEAMNNDLRWPNKDNCKYCPIKTRCKK